MATEIKGPASVIIGQPATGEEAAELVKQLQQDFDLIDDTQMLRELVEKMEQRHSEQFETFFEVVITRFLMATGLKEITLDTNNLFSELAAPRRLILTAAPGKLTYRLPENEDGQNDV